VLWIAKGFGSRKARKALDRERRERLWIAKGAKGSENHETKARSGEARSGEREDAKFVLTSFES
jgi:hypothetical protein